MKLVIDRKKWGRGGPEGVLLDRETKQMCCLGFLAKNNCGLPAKRIRGVGAPSDLGEMRFKSHERQQVWDALSKPLKKPRWAISPKADDCVDEPASNMEAVLIRINDSTKITDKRREKLLTKEFAKIGVEVEFVGEGA